MESIRREDEDDIEKSMEKYKKDKEEMEISRIVVNF